MYTKMRGMDLLEILNNVTAFMFSNDLMKNIAARVCIRLNDIIGDGLGKGPVNNVTFLKILCV